MTAKMAFIAHLTAGERKIVGKVDSSGRSLKMSVLVLTSLTSKISEPIC
jgi:hypothetical protein